MNDFQSTTLKTLGHRLFSYAVIADTHVNHSESNTNSVYPVNRLHNARLRHVVREINSQENLAFVMHLGDLVHPVPAIPDLFVEASLRFKELTDGLKFPMHLVPGNHDVGDKPCDWTPAVCIQNEFIDLYRKHFGEDYYAFEHDAVHFIQLNVQLLNSGLPDEKIQADWLEGYLQAHAGSRFIMNVHYPVFLTSRNEDPHYDNIDEPGRTWLLDLMAQHSVEALFAGHVHNFWYQRYDATDCYYLPSTACIRQDYSEMARIAPDHNMEGGRDDQPKHGYMLVHVHQHGHYCEVKRTYGEEAPVGSENVALPVRVRALHPIENSRASLSFDMRQDWMETVQVPPSGGPDDFARKLARNDYSLMAIWEMGVRRLRIPKNDLLDPVRLSRLQALRGHGQEFVLYTYGIPDVEFIQILIKNPGLIDAWEVIFPWVKRDEVISAIEDLKDKTSIEFYLAKLRGKEEHEDGSSKFVHAINYGFTINEVSDITEVTQHSWIDGVVFRVGRDALICETLCAANEICASAKTKASMIIRMSTISPADFQSDDIWVANRVAEALAVSVALEHVQVTIDTFTDIDRGYFRRNGVLDRLFNPRLGFHIVQNLYSSLNTDSTALSIEQVIQSGHIRSLILKRGSRHLILVMPTISGEAFDVSGDLGPEFADSVGSAIDLKTGNITSDIPAQLESPILLIE